MISDDPPPSYQSISVRDAEEEGEGNDDNGGNATTMERMEINTGDTTTRSTPYSSNTLLWVYVILLTLASSIGFYTLFQHQIALENEIMIYKSKIETIQSSLSLEMHTIESAIQSMNNNMTAEISDIGSSINSHSVDIHGLTDTVNRLSNRTTNADVLDRLATTHQMVLHELNGTKLAIAQQMIDSKQSLDQTQINIKNQMEITQTHINHVIDNAEAHLGQVQSNMTAKIRAMGASVDDTVKKLDIDVSAAEARIHDDVNMLQENVEKYVTLTNKQFEQEDDFVKYQLAGTFTLLACLMSLYHVTGHFRHLNKPEIQRRIMAVLWMVRSPLLL